MNKFEEKLRELVFFSLKDGSNYNILELKLSQIPANLRTRSVMEKIRSFFEGLTTPDGHIVFVPCGDLFVFYPQRIAQGEAESILIRVWFLFTKDPDELAGGHMHAFFKLPDEKAALFEEIRLSCVREGVAGEFEKVVEEPVKKELKELTPEGLDKVITALSRADFSNMIRRQSVCALIDDAAPQELYEEVFVSIADLGDAILPDISLTSTPWLFQYLTETLDKRVLATTSRHEDGSFTRDFSLNLNVSTILSDAFEEFNYNLISTMRSSIVLEMQPVDILSDLPSYLKARDYVQGLGFKVCLDGVTATTLPFMDRERLGADFLKLVCSPQLIERLQNDAAFKACFDAVGQNRLIVCRVDDEEAVRALKEAGATLFQGRYIQNLLNAPRQRPNILR